MKNWVPHTYQKKSVKFLLEHAAAALWLDPGLGKTSITLAAFKMLFKKQISRKMLVIAPLRPCYLVWPKEVEEWAEFNQFKVAILHGPGKEAAVHSDADIYVINPEGLEWLTSKAPGSKYTRLQIILDGDNGAVLAVDEVTKFKHTNTLRFKTIAGRGAHAGMLRYFGYRWTLTGTCAPNGYLDLFGQIFVADMGVALGKYISHYRASYFDAGGYGNHTFTLQDGAEKKIQTKLKPLVLRMDAEDYLDLPKLLVNKVMVELPPAARKVYDELEIEMYSQLEGGEIVTALGAAAASMKCRQVANGGLYLNKDVPGELLRQAKNREWVDLHTAKIDAVQEIIESVQGKPVFITYDFNHDLARLRVALGKDVPVLGGKGSGPAGIKYDKMLEAAWNNDELPVLLGHPASIGHGLNLQKSSCADMIIHSDTWDQELYDQVIRRVRRQGNTVGFLRLHHIIAIDTVDETLYASHGRKGGVQKALMDAMKNRRRSQTPFQVVENKRRK